MPRVKNGFAKAKLTTNKPKSRHASPSVGALVTESDRVTAEGVDFISRRGKSQSSRLDKACELLPRYFEALVCGSNYEASSMFDTLAMYCRLETRQLLEHYRDMVKEYVKVHFNDEDTADIDDVTAINISSTHVASNNEMVLTLRRFIASLDAADFLSVVA